MDIGLAKALKETRKVSAAVISPLVVLSFQYFILVSFNLTGTASGARVQFMSKMLVGLIFIYAFPVVWNNNKNKLIGTYFIATLIFVFYYLVFPSNRTYMNEHIFPLFFMGLPAFVYARSVLDWRILKEVMKKASSIVLVLGLIVAALVITGRGVYSMPFFYCLRRPAITFQRKF
ncbi:MAG: hypothetical protein GX956_04815 [Firmicutes bacterium]|nr:hypothetical protein [Bacillota bacterium]